MNKRRADHVAWGGNRCRQNCEGSISETWENQENNVKVDLKELGSKSADRIEVLQDKF
jgi:hypothetical protein